MWLSRCMVKGAETCSKLTKAHVHPHHERSCRMRYGPCRNLHRGTTRCCLLVRTSKLPNGNAGHDSPGNHLPNRTNPPTVRASKSYYRSVPPVFKAPTWSKYRTAHPSRRLIKPPESLECPSFSMLLDQLPNGSHAIGFLKAPT
ncbi:unnamed protein product [Prunus armeniaca]